MRISVTCRAESRGLGVILYARQEALVGREHRACFIRRGGKRRDKNIRAAGTKALERGEVRPPLGSNP